MLKKIDKFTVFNVIFFVAIFLFWWLYKPEALYYQESFQIFLWDSNYFKECLSITGGLCDYISEFLVQFYYYPALGSAIIALIFVGIVLTIRKVRSAVRYPKDDGGFSIMDTVPAFMLWYTMYDINVMHNVMVAILLSLLLAWNCVAALRNGNTWWKVSAMALVPVGYYLLGPAIYITMIISTAYIIMQKKNYYYALAMAIGVALAMAVSMHYVMYPVPRFFYGINYFRFHDFNAWIWTTIMLAAVVPIININLKKLNSKTVTIAETAIWGLTAILIFNRYNDYKYQTIKYLKWTHECRWADIVADAEKNRPETPATQIMVNTALAFEQQLTERMFQFPQSGMECLYPTDINDMLHPLLFADALYWMGLNDHAIHFYFESKAGNPTYKGSCISYRNLAKCYIINEEYATAYKYIRKLEKTLFYKDLAKFYRQLVETNSTDNYQEFATIKSIKLKTNGLQAVENMASSFRNLIEENPQNYLAFEFLMGAHLLEGDIEGIIMDYDLGKNLGYRKMPKHIQEALIFYVQQKNGNINNLPPQISDDVRSRFAMKLITEDSYWNYLKNNQEQ